MAEPEKKQLRACVFQDASLEATGRRLKDESVTTSVIIGRFSPFHEGHRLFFESVMATGLDFHVVLNANVYRERKKSF